MKKHLKNRVFLCFVIAMLAGCENALIFKSEYESINNYKGIGKIDVYNAGSESLLLVINSKKGNREAYYFDIPKLEVGLAELKYFKKLRFINGAIVNSESKYGIPAFYGFDKEIAYDSDSIEITIKDFQIKEFDQSGKQSKNNT